MALFELKIYGADDEVKKTYETHRIKYGLIEDFIDLSKDLEGKNQLQQFALMKPILKTLFPGVTDEELRETDFIQVSKVILSLYDVVKNGYGSEEKN